MKRGSSDLSLVVPVNKQKGMSSHDVVNACRKIYGERRVGHAGTLDPFAEGVLPLCIGPATRLVPYIMNKHKTYRACIQFGDETSTDDCEGEIVAHAEVPEDIYKGAFAHDYIKGLVGIKSQVPPVYSAIKIEGKRAYELARAGNAPKMKKRTIEILDARLLDRTIIDSHICWNVEFCVSKGTYIRALARDIGRELGCYAHLRSLVRTSAGSLNLCDCVDLNTLKTFPFDAIIDPLILLDLRFTFMDHWAFQIENGSHVSAEDLVLFELPHLQSIDHLCSCTQTIQLSNMSLKENEMIAVVISNKLKALYVYDNASRCIKPACVFAKGVARV